MHKALTIFCCFALSAAAANSAADVLAFEKAMEAAVVRGDVAFLDKICASDFSFTHGDGWTTGGAKSGVLGDFLVSGGVYTEG